MYHFQLKKCWLYIFVISLFIVQSSQGVLDFLMVLRVLRLVKIMGQIKRFVGFLFENFQLLRVINIWRVSAQSNPTFHFSVIFIHTWHKPSCFRRIHLSLCHSKFLRPPGPRNQCTLSKRNFSYSSKLLTANLFL